MAEPPTLAKLVLLGDMGAGKSCLVIRFVKGTFDEHHESTIGAAFTTKTMPEHGVKLEIWDTAGQERYHSLAPMYYRGAAAAIIVFDVTDTQSFEKAKAWVGELQRQATANIVMALAANKVDLADARKVTAEEGKAYASANVRGSKRARVGGVPRSSQRAPQAAWLLSCRSLLVTPLPLAEPLVHRDVGQGGHEREGSV